MATKALAAVAVTTSGFTNETWTTVDLSTVGPNMTEQKPGSDLHSWMVECKAGSAAPVHVVLRNDPGAGVPATDGWEIEQGGVMGDEAVRGLRYMSFRSILGNGTVKIMIRADRTDLEAPWSS